MEANRNSQPQVADLSRWAEAILLAARHLGLANSPELVRGAAAWADASDTARAVVEMAAAAGLNGQFVTLAPTALSTVMLPALACIDGQHVGMIVAVADGKAALHLPTDSGVVERTPALDTLLRDGRLHVLLVREREAPRSDRLDAYIAAQAPSGWR